MFRFLNSLKTVCALTYSLLGDYKEQPRGKNLIVIHTGKLGDMICATPMIRAAASDTQGFNLVVVSDRINQDILAYNKDVSSFTVWPKGVLNRIKTLRSAHPDIVCITTPNLDALVSAIFSGARTVIAPRVVGGFSPYMTRAYKILLSRVASVPFKMNEYVPQQYINLLVPLGISSNDTSKRIFFSDQALRIAQEKIKNDNGGRAIGIALGAGNLIKQWPVTKFVQLVQVLLERNDDDVLYIFGGMKEKDIIQDFMSRLSDTEKKRVVVVSDVSIDELKACIAQLDLFVGVDTGPIYIAEALKVPLVDIIGPVSEKEQPPLVPYARLVYLKDRKKPEIHIMNSRVYNVAEARRQIEEITVEMVLTAIDELIN